MVVFGGPTTWASKVTILALYGRLFFCKVWLRWSCYLGFIVLTLIYWASPIFASIFCLPRAGHKWDSMVLARCNQTFVMGTVYSSISVATDILLLILPLPVILSLKMAKSQKIALAAVFMTASL